MSVSEKDIRQALERLGIAELNAMQQQMLGCDARSILLIAPTGSGKTLAFILAMLNRLKAPGADGVQAVVIAPSRELVMQTASVVRTVAHGYKTVALYGGHSVMDERNSLTPLPDIIIATPGRLLDHINRGHIEVANPAVLVLDEYDKSLELGFEGEMKKICRRLHRPANVVLTSATFMGQMPDYLDIKNPTLIDYSVDAADTKARMDIVEVQSYTPDKLDTLTSLLRTLTPGERAIVFVNHRESAERVYQRLKSDRFDVALYHGALDQMQRQTAIDLLANGTVNILVATDLAARGLDIEDLTHVVHYHLPVNAEAWTHRNGRTARVDRTGTVWVITSERDSIPDYVAFDRTFQPSGETSIDPVHTGIATIHIAAGKKEKISKGDVAGFVSASGVVNRDEIGRITVHDHYALVAVPHAKAADTIAALRSMKLKGKKTRVSLIKP